MQDLDFNSPKTQENSDIQTLQSLQQLLKKEVESQVAMIDWNNKDVSNVKKQNLFLYIIRTVAKYFKNIGGCPPKFTDIFQQYLNQANLGDNQPEKSNHKKPNGITSEDIDALLSNTNLLQGESKLSKYDSQQNSSIYNNESLKSSFVTVNKNQLSESNYHQKGSFSSNPFKQRIIDNEQQQKPKRQVEDEFSKEDSGNDDNGSDGGLLGSSMRGKIIQKKKYQFPTNRFDHRELPNQPRPRGRPPNVIEQPSGAKSLFEATAEERQKVLDYYHRHYDPQRRNKIQIVNQIAQEGRYSQSSIYQFLTNPENPKPPTQTQSFYKPSRTTSSYQSQLQQQQQQQIQYYKQNRHLFNSSIKSKEDIGRVIKLSQNAGNQQIQNRKMRLTPTGNYSSSHPLSQSQNYNSFSQHQPKSHPNFQQSQNHHFQDNGFEQGDSDSGQFQNHLQQQNNLLGSEPQKNINHLGLVDSHQTYQYNFHRNASKEMMHAEL